MPQLVGFQHRSAPKEGLDDFPTPPWAARALFVAGSQWLSCADKMTCWEPAANRGFMVAALEEQFKTVIASDVVDYGAGFPLADFLDAESYVPPLVDWVITNPPFNKAEAFAQRCLDLGRSARLRLGFAFLLRSAWIEGEARHRRLFSLYPPTAVLQFVERVNIVPGRLDERASRQMPYAWFLWSFTSKRDGGGSRLMWIPKCKEKLTRDGDYSETGEAVVSPR